MKTKKHISQEELKEKLMRALIISFIICLFFSCTYHKANDSMKKKSIIAQPDTIQERKESFEYFIKKFHKDRTFMLSRIKDSIKGLNTDDHIIDDTLETEYIWKKQDIIIYMEDVNKAYYSSEYKKEYRILENKDIEEYIYIPNSSCFYKCIYRFTEKWYMVEFIVNTL